MKSRRKRDKDTINMSGLRQFRADDVTSTVKVTITISPEDLEWIDSLPGKGRSAHFRRALKTYKGWWNTFGSQEPV